MPLEVGESGYLNFDRKAYDREVVVDANSSGAVSLRFLDAGGNVVIDNLTIEAGTSGLLNGLEYNTDYIVEMKTKGAFVCLSFF